MYRLLLLAEKEPFHCLTQKVRPSPCAAAETMVQSLLHITVMPFVSRLGRMGRNYLNHFFVLNSADAQRMGCRLCLLGNRLWTNIPAQERCKATCWRPQLWRSRLQVGGQKEKSVECSPCRGLRRPLRKLWSWAFGGVLSWRGARPSDTPRRARQLSSALLQWGSTARACFWRFSQQLGSKFCIQGRVSR